MISIKPVSENEDEDLEQVCGLGASSVSDAFVEKGEQTVTNKEPDLAFDPKKEDIKPFFKNQLIKHPESCRVSKLQSYILNLSKPEDLDLYNALQTKSLSVDSGVAIQSRQTEFYNGTWIAFITAAYYVFQSPLSNK